MFQFLLGIPALLTGAFTTVQTVSNNLANEKIALIGATTDRERAEIGERVSALTVQRDVLIAEASKSNIVQYVQLGFALPLMFYFGKVYAWDKALDWGSTPDLSANEWYMAWMILGFFFVHSTVGLLKR